LARSRGQRLGVGVVGLGRLWEARHKPALGRLRERFRVAAVYDQVLIRAEREARELGCAAAEGIAALVERSDVDAVYVLTPQWFGLHAAELACRADKPVYCALNPASDPEGLRAVSRLVRERGTPFFPELPRRFYPVTIRLRELLATTLGSPTLVLGHARIFGFDRYGDPGPNVQLAPTSPLIDPGGNLVDWCRLVFGADPLAATGTGSSGDADFEGFTLEFSDGRLAQVGIGRYHRERWGEASRFLPQPGFQVFTDRGAAWLEMPDRIQWTDDKGLHDERLPTEPTVGELLNLAFDRLLRGESPAAATLDDALAVARIVDALRRSRSEGRRIALD
jgi:predicted dehydrogenase